MKVKSTFGIFFILTLFVTTAVFTTTAFCQEEGDAKQGETVDVKAQKSRGDASQPDENIKSSSKENDPNSQAPAPPTKGGESTRGYCLLVVDNWTPWIIDVYLNGSYIGDVSRWGKASQEYTSGSGRLYAVANFTDGSQLTWGPTSITCSGSYTWKLTK